VSEAENQKRKKERKWQAGSVKRKGVENEAKPHEWRN
jgi:hypothetical protein